MNTGSRAVMLQAALSLAIVAALTSAASDAAPLVGTQVTVAHATRLHQGDAVLGTLPMSQPMRIEVALKLRDRAGLETFIASNAKSQAGHPASRPMTSAQFLADHAPTQEQAQAVANYLTGKGYRNVVIAPDRLLVSADGTAATARDAFQTSFAQVRTGDGRIAFANTADAVMPAGLNESVVSVVGLQTVHQAHILARVIRPDAAHPHAVATHNPIDFAAIYGGTGIGVQGVTVGIISEGELRQTLADLKTFTSNNGLPPTNTGVIYTGGTSGDTSNTVEWDLDSQDIVGAGGSLLNLRFYDVPTLSDTDLTADYDTAAAIGLVGPGDHTPVINVSLGECERDAEDSGAAAAQDQIFAAAAAQGQTFAVASGDSGSDECGDGSTGASWPAASEYVLAVGGTTLDASSTTWNDETVWSGSGGSPSSFEPKPIWQYALVRGKTRGVPDVAFDADPESGALIVFNGKSAQVGGTSLAAPIFSGLWARAEESQPGLGQVYGFAGPLLYLLPQPYFHDITVGNNGGYKAGVGYDFASGRGSFNLATVLPQLENTVGDPPVVNFSHANDGLEVHFKDQSTDSDGSIVAHLWTFGDGSPAVTTANPTHTYPGAGTFEVFETVSDNSGNLVTGSANVTVHPPGAPSQLIRNTGFETGMSPWAMTANVWCGPISQNTLCDRAFAPFPHAGDWFAFLDGYGQAHTDTVSQQVTIPAGLTSATLAFWLQVNSQEVTTTRAFDKLTVGVYTPSGALLGTLATFSNLDKADGYQLHSYSMAQWIGQTVVLRFTGTEDTTLVTEFALDDVTLQVK